MAMGMGGGGGGGMSGGGGGGGGMSAAPAAMSAAMSGGGNMGGEGNRQDGTGRRINPQQAPRRRSLQNEMSLISEAAGNIANAQADAAIRTNDRFQDSAQESTREIAAELDNDFTRRAQENLTGAQAGIDQVQSAQTGIGQLRDSYAAQGQDPAMQRLNQQALGQLYSPDQLRAGQVSADQVSGARVADIGGMQAAQATGPSNVQAQSATAAQGTAAQMAGVADVQSSSVGGIERVGGVQVGGVDPMEAARVRRVQEIGTNDIRASAAERGLMQEARGNGLYGQLRDQASNDLALGRSLSAEQNRDATQSARAGYAARGLGLGQSAMAAELLNRDRFGTQREAERRAFAGNVLNQGTGLQQAANQAYMGRMDANANRALQAASTNQSVAQARAMQNAQFSQQARLTDNQNAQQRVLAEAGYAQQAGLSNQDFSFRAGSQDAQLAQQAALANQQAGLATNQFNAGNQQQMALANMQNQQQVGLANQDAYLRAGLANQQTGLQLGLTNAQLAQQANAATFESAQQRAMANAGYQQQAALSNQSANLNAAQYNVGQDMAAQQANQQANQTQEQYNRAFLGQVAGMNFDQNQARTSMLSGLYGQQAGLGQTTASLQQGMAQSQVALDPYQRALGSSMPIATIAPSTNLIGQAYGQTMNYGSDLFNTNTNMQASIYNSYQNNKVGIKAAQIQAGATKDAGMMQMGGAVAGASATAGAAAALCWIARACMPTRWRAFRRSMLRQAPDRFIAAYCRHGERLAANLTTPLRRFTARLTLRTLEWSWN